MVGGAADFTATFEIAGADEATGWSDKKETHSRPDIHRRPPWPFATLAARSTLAFLPAHGAEGGRSAEGRDRSTRAASVWGFRPKSRNRPCRKGRRWGLEKERLNVKARAEKSSASCRSPVGPRPAGERVVRAQSHPPSHRRTLSTRRVTLDPVDGLSSQAGLFGDLSYSLAA